MPRVKLSRMPLTPTSNEHTASQTSMRSTNLIIHICQM